MVIQGCYNIVYKVVFSTLLQHSDNLLTTLSPHCDNLDFETVTALSQPCDKVKVQLIWGLCLFKEYREQSYVMQF